MVLVNSRVSPCALRVGAFGSPVLLRSVEAIVRTEPGMEWAGSAAEVNTAIEICESGTNVLLIDSEWDPDWKLCLMLTNVHPELTVVGLLGSAARNPVASSWALLHGVSGIVGTDAETDRLRDAIRDAVDFGHYVDPGLEVTAKPAARRPDVPGKPLSAREFEVLQLVADGRTAGQIGHRLGITADTVRTHICHILRKLNARDRAHAVALSFQMSLLPGRSRPSV